MQKIVAAIYFTAKWGILLNIPANTMEYLPHQKQFADGSVVYN